MTRPVELQLLAQRRCRLQQEIAAIRARLDARGGATAIAGRHETHCRIASWLLSIAAKATAMAERLEKHG
jgi:hypothetical protein